jgi:hypothetical protein
MKHNSGDLYQVLSGPHRELLLIEFTLGNVSYYLSNHDVPLALNGHDYIPGFVLDVSDIEQTSTPKINEITVRLDAVDRSFVALFYSQHWMNKPFTVLAAIYRTDNTLAGQLNLYQGLISKVDLVSKGNPYLQIGIASVWADFDKSASIQSNVGSHQRFYEFDTGFRWAAIAGLKVPWGKPGANPPKLGDNGNGTPQDDPDWGEGAPP